jgi:hypothetical protein
MGATSYVHETNETWNRLSSLADLSLGLNTHKEKMPQQSFVNWKSPGINLEKVTQGWIPLAPS